jgi:hypothetical protein
MATALAAVDDIATSLGLLGAVSVLSGAYCLMLKITKLVLSCTSIEALCCLVALCA